jgi:hexokinase
LQNLPVKLVALINDTTGALIASAYNDPKTIIGAIFGTGCNAAYMEDTSRIPKLHKASTQDGTNSPNRDDSRTPDSVSQGNSSITNGTSPPPSQPPPSSSSLMAINCEYGAFDNQHTILPRTMYDKLIDSQSPRPGEQTFEKMSAGLYLGEILRQILLHLYARADDFSPYLSNLSAEQHAKLDKPYILDTEFLAVLENDAAPPKDPNSASRQTFAKTLAGLSPTEHEMVFFTAVAKLVALRGARLAACGASAIAKRLGARSGHVAADGSVATKHPRFKERWESAVREILDMKFLFRSSDGNGQNGDDEHEGIVLTSAEDGSGVGAGVICALALGRSTPQ